MKKPITHIMASCFECGQDWSNYSNAKEQAMKHADTYGHSITGELTIRFHYTGKKKKK